MRINRLYCEPPFASESELELDRQRAHYLCHVLRMRTGDKLVVFDGQGNAFRATLSDTAKNSATITVLDEIEQDVESSLDLHLIQGLSRGDRMDFTIQKAVELGIQRITPIYTRYSNIKLSADRIERKIEHWRNIAISACEQCGRNRVPEIDSTLSFERLPDVLQEGSLRLMMHPGGDHALSDLDPPAHGVQILIGPEGGFSDSEVAYANGKLFRTVRLGPRVLRTETAALGLLSAIQTLWGDFRL